MGKQYNPSEPSTGYDMADFAALKASNITPALATEALRFDSADDASIFFARELDYIKAKSYDKVYNEGEINSFLQSQKRALISGASAEQVLKEIGIFQKDLIQDKIESGSFAPNAASTIRQKGSSKPLIDTGRMRQSVDYVIKAKGSSD